MSRALLIALALLCMLALFVPSINATEERSDLSMVEVESVDRVEVLADTVETETEAEADSSVDEPALVEVDSESEVESDSDADAESDAAADEMIIPMRVTSLSEVDSAAKPKKATNKTTKAAPKSVRTLDKQGVINASKAAATVAKGNYQKVNMTSVRRPLPPHKTPLVNRGVATKRRRTGGRPIPQSIVPMDKQHRIKERKQIATRKSFDIKPITLNKIKTSAMKKHVYKTDRSKNRVAAAREKIKANLAFYTNSSSAAPKPVFTSTSLAAGAKNVMRFAQLAHRNKVAASVGVSYQAAQLVSGRYDPHLAFITKRLNQAAYCADNKVQGWKCEVCRIAPLNNVLPETVHVFQASNANALNTFGYAGIMSLPNMGYFIFVSFRGTNDVWNWFADLDFRMDDDDVIPGLIHNGFQEGYGNLALDVRATVQNLRKQCTNCKVVFTGHSLGGALATVAAADHIASNAVPYDDMLVYTFGSPRVGNAEFANWFDSYMKGGAWRIVHFLDIVPRVPSRSPLLKEYQHVSTEVWFHSNGDQDTVQGKYSTADPTTHYSICQSSGDAADKDPNCSDSKLGPLLLNVKNGIIDHLAYLNEPTGCTREDIVEMGLVPDADHTF